MSENNLVLLNSIVLAGGLAGSIYLFSTGLMCINLYSLDNQKTNKYLMYLNGSVMGLSGLAFATMCYKNSHVFFKSN